MPRYHLAALQEPQPGAANSPQSGMNLGRSVILKVRALASLEGWTARAVALRGSARCAEHLMVTDNTDLASQIMT
jgi:hypothetical protein